MSPPDDTSTELMARPAGRESSIEALLALHDRDVRSALRRVLGRSQEEDDLVQEVFTRLVLRLRQPGDLCVGAWVRGVAHNLAVDEIRRRRPVPVEDSRLDREVASPAEERLAGAELYSRLVEGAHGLPERQRAALAAALSGGGPGVAGVASALGVSVHAAESLLSRARCGLRSHLATAGADSDGGSVRVSLGATLAGLTAALTWLLRRWRAAAALTVATGALTTVAWIPLLQNPPPAAVARSVAGAAAAVASPMTEAAGPPAAEGIPADDPAPPAAGAAAGAGASASAAGTAGAGSADDPAPLLRWGPLPLLPLDGAVPVDVALPEPCATVAPAHDPAARAGELVRPLAAASPPALADTAPAAGGRCPLDPIPVPVPVR